MRNTFPNHPDELSSSHQPELSYQPKNLVKLTDTDTRLSYPVIWHHIISPKISSTISCVLNEPQWEPGSHSFQNPFAGKIGSKQEHTAYRHPGVFATWIAETEVPGFSGPTIKGDGGWITPPTDGNLKLCAVGHQKSFSNHTDMIIEHKIDMSVWIVTDRTAARRWRTGSVKAV